LTLLDLDAGCSQVLGDDLYRLAERVGWAEFDDLGSGEQGESVARRRE